VGAAGTGTRGHAYASNNGKQMRGDEARARRPHVTVAQMRLVVHVKALRHDDVQVFLRTRHRYV